MLPLISSSTSSRGSRTFGAPGLVHPLLVPSVPAAHVVDVTVPRRELLPEVVLASTRRPRARDDHLHLQALSWRLLLASLTAADRAAQLRSVITAGCRSGSTRRSRAPSPRVSGVSQASSSISSFLTRRSALQALHPLLGAREPLRDLALVRFHHEGLISSWPARVAPRAMPTESLPSLDVPPLHRAHAVAAAAAPRPRVDDLHEGSRRRARYRWLYPNRPRSARALLEMDHVLGVSLVSGLMESPSCCLRHMPKPSVLPRRRWSAPVPSSPRARPGSPSRTSPSRAPVAPEVSPMLLGCVSAVPSRPWWVRPGGAAHRSPPQRPLGQTSRSADRTPRIHGEHAELADRRWRRPHRSPQRRRGGSPSRRRPPPHGGGPVSVHPGAVKAKETSPPRRLAGSRDRSCRGGGHQATATAASARSPPPTTPRPGPRARGPP